MPHLIIESSVPLPKETIEALHKELGQQESVSLSSVKTRLYCPQVSFFADPQNSQPHTAITLKMLPGRSQKLRQKITNALFTKARELIPEGGLSVESLDLGIYEK